ncbi:MAG: hypothetical protein ACKOXB_01110 [Flavobacteriales bacterium]
MSANTERSDKLIGATATIIFHSILFLILFFMVIGGGSGLGDSIGDSEGLEVSFGEDAEGSGNTESTPAGAESPASQPESSPEEELLSSSASDDDVVVKKTDDTKKKTPTKVTTTKNPNTKKVDSDLEAAMKGMLGGTGTDGDGDSKTPGNEGGGGETHGRDKGKGKGKGKTTLITKHVIRQANYDSQQEGYQYVKVKINRQGKVVAAEGNQKGTTNASPELKGRAEKLVRGYVFNEDPAGPEFRYETIPFNFYLQ